MRFSPSRLIECCPYQIRELLEGADVEISEDHLILTITDSRRRVAVHAQIERLINVVAHLLPDVLMIKLQAPGVRSLPIPVSLALTSDDSELILPAGAIESRQTLKSRIEAARVFDALIQICHGAVILVVDPDRTIVNTNAAAWSYTADKQNLIGQPWQIEEYIWRAILEARRQKVPYSFNHDRQVLAQLVKFSGIAKPSQESIIIALKPDPQSAKLLASYSRR